MKLKRLEIIGFKSFAEKTIIDFEKDITAIVGPNGCGKSNVVDSIRWVMGEQSAKHLRGKNMEDVIFAGSSNRPPLSMASVELTFSTEGYQTPAAYLNHSEIAICRRLYRTGDSEYLINKTPVRLRDITELFLGTGIGTKAYSVIEQGRISQIVTAKPIERRFYIEEVAGITKFKSRKEAALRKMESTNQNLLRLNDVIEELERQMKSLDRQAKKAEKYQQIKTEYQKWDLALSSNRLDRHTKDQDELESQLRGFDDREIELKNKLSQAENQLEEERVKVSEQEIKISEVTNHNFEVTNYIKIIENTLSHKKEEIKNLQTAHQDIDSEIEQIKSNLNEIKESQMTTSHKKMENDFQLIEFLDKNESLEPGVKEIQSKLSSLTQHIDELKNDFSAKKNRMVKVETILETNQQKIVELQENISQEKQEFDQCESKIHELNRVYGESHSSLENLKQLKLDLSHQSGELENLLKQAREHLSEQQKGLEKIKDELTQKKSRLDSLLELQKNFEGYHEGTRQVLLKKNDISQEGIFGTVADFVETDSEYEGAVSAILGEKLQHVLVKSSAEGLQAIDYLQTHSGGRASFIPLDLRNVDSEQEDFDQESGVIGPLNQYVRVKNDYAHMLPNLLQDVVLVNDIDTALSLWQRKQYKKTFVTLKGEMIDPLGVITGGSLEDTSKAILEKKRESKELQEFISVLSQQVLEKEVLCDELIKKVGSMEMELENVKKNTHEEEIKIVNQEKDVSHFKKEIESLTRQKELLEKKLTLRQDQLDTIIPQSEELDSEKINLEKLILEIESELNESIHSSESLKVEADKKQAELNDVQIQLTKAESLNEQVKEEISRLENEYVRQRFKMRSLQKDLFTSRHDLGFISNYVSHLEKVLGKRLEKKDKIDKELSGMKEIFEGLVQSLREKEEQIRIVRKDYEGVSKDLNRITLNLSETRTQIKYLAEQCLERHQIDIQEIYKDHLDESLDESEAEGIVKDCRSQLSRIGAVNTDALEEFEETKQRFDFLSAQKLDLESSLASLTQVIDRINSTTQERFLATFNAVNENFQNLYPKMFRGGKAKLVLTDEDNLLETGVEIVAQPPGKKLQSINLLSGGEKALTAVSLVFSIFKVKPSPFCILDEVDAPLDEVNVSRYNETLRAMTNNTQFIVITHNKRTMEMADVLYGVTMPEPGASRLVSVDLHD